MFMVIDFQLTITSTDPDEPDGVFNMSLVQSNYAGTKFRRYVWLCCSDLMRSTRLPS